MLDEGKINILLGYIEFINMDVLISDFELSVLVKVVEDDFNSF